MNEVSLADDVARLGLGARPPAENNDDELGQGDFLTLMIAQFRNQDPFSPMDNGEFLGQLAQFGTVDGIDQLNRAFSDLSDSFYSDQALQAANLVGHRVLAASDRAYLPEDGSLNGTIALAASAQNVQIDVLDSSGQLLRRLNLGEQEPGLIEFEWDGITDAAGADAASPGTYTLEARVIRGANVEGTETLIEAQIDSVNLGRLGQGMTLNVEGGDVLTMNQVRRIL